MSKAIKPIKLLLFIYLPILPHFLNAQIVPKDGSVLNYRLIGFSFPSKLKAISYTLQIALGNYESEDSFRKKVLYTLPAKYDSIIAEVPLFGNQYTWRVIYFLSKSNKISSTFFHFSTGAIPEIDTTVTRLRITKPTLKYKDAYVFLDGDKVLYDMAGHPIWYLPPIEGQSNSVRDLKLTPQGTITFLEKNAYEINYNGEILWASPDNARISGQSKENYHNEFTRLKNGHYMILGNEVLFTKRVQQNDGSFQLAFDKNTKPDLMDNSFRLMPFGTIIEYDSLGNILWFWKTSKYYEESDLKFYLPPTLMPNEIPIVDLHDNSFFFDEKNQTIYLNYKNIDRVLKIKYPEGNVISAYGELYRPGTVETGNNLFCGAHSIKIAQDSCIFLFNNNACNLVSSPKIEKLQEPSSKPGKLKKIWEFECVSDIKSPNGFTTGGNIIELRDQSIFVSTAAPDSRLFIVNMDKEILWNALPEKWNELEKKWEPLTQYRASIVENRRDLERLIWNTRK